MTTPETANEARAWVAIDLGALVANARTIAALSGSRLLPMVKANGYGLGAARVAEALCTVDPWGFGVATIEEGRDLRRTTAQRPIVVFTPPGPDLLSSLIAHDLRPAIGDLRMLAAWIAASDRPFHLEIDTGMGRAGLRYDDTAELQHAGDLLRGAAGWEGVFTHFHSAESDAAATDRQWERFQGVLNAFPRRPPLTHAANSAGALRSRRYGGDLVRPGIFLYGGEAGGPVPCAVASLRAPVVGLRRLAPAETVSYGATWQADAATWVATVAAGYADGLPRAAGNRGMIEIRGRAHPIVGRVTMDMAMVAVDDLGIALGDVATIYGGIVSLDQQAAAAGTISYELLSGLGPRVPRVYQQAP